MNPNDTANAGNQDLQNSITKLNAMKQQSGANIPAINQQIKSLIAKQTDLRTLALKQDIDDASNQAAIKAMTAAATALNTAAENIKNVATAFNDAAQVITAATSLITALAPFVA